MVDYMLLGLIMVDYLLPDKIQELLMIIMQKDLLKLFKMILKDKKSKILKYLPTVSFLSLIQELFITQECIQHFDHKNFQFSQAPYKISSQPKML
jgi:hypothetical protein